MIPPLDVDATSEAGKPRASGDDPAKPASPETAEK